MYKPEDVKVISRLYIHICDTNWSRQLTWHDPNEEEIDFVLQIFREFIEPILDTLHALLEPGICHHTVTLVSIKPIIFRYCS